MKRSLSSIIALVGIACCLPSQAERLAGGDISLLPEYLEAGAKYLTHDGKPIEALLPWLYDEGLNAMRVRLFVDPEAYQGEDKDLNACQDLEYILPLCRDIKEAGFSLLLDFHYSDTWADPGKQWTPAAWSELTDEELFERIYEYTSETLKSLTTNDIVPDLIQPGNEISYGMLWGPYGTPDDQLKKTFMGSDANWERLGNLLDNAIRACREECPEAEIIIHTERTSNIEEQQNFYDWMKRLDVDYDIIGLSFYPYFHGTLQSLDNSIKDLERRYPDKQIMIVETGFPYAWEIPGTTCKPEYPYSEEGQKNFMRDMVNMLETHSSVSGLFWWWMEYNAYDTSLSDWYNAPLFDSRTGRATEALDILASFASNMDTGTSPLYHSSKDDKMIFDLSGRRLNRPVSGQPYIRNGHTEIRISGR